MLSILPDSNSSGIKPGPIHTDTWVAFEDLDAEIDDWDAGQFRWLGQVYELTWFDDAATEALRRQLQIEADDEFRAG
ncbi:MAG: hypothetical protein LWW86_01615 [Micrococcales bacterium]|nr:hypothetical protein [Micrococcales bacterium]